MKGDKHNAKMRVRTAPVVASVREIRRTQVSPVPTGTLRNVVKGLTGTMFQNRVHPVTADTVVLKGGENNSKLGGMVMVGRLRGARLVSLALEERKTCPRACPLWDGCYTNNLSMQVRFKHGDVLEAKIALEVAQLCEDYEKVLVRLHISGDFYSEKYLALWANLLDRFPGLHIFGFSAWEEDTPIGRGIAWMRKQDPARFAVRTSGRTGRWGSFTIPYPDPRPLIGQAAVCPEQRDAMEGHQRGTHCASCGLCWKTGGAATGRPIAFVEH